MKKILVFIVTALALCACQPSLEQNRWESDTYHALSALIADPQNKGAYAVFDCDYTTVVNDISHSLITYMIENLRFATAPEHMFLAGLPEVDVPLEGIGMTAREMGETLAREYAELKTEWKDSLYQDFRARFVAFQDAIGDYYDYGTLCLWEPSIAVGFSAEELQALGRESLSYWLSQGRTWMEEWKSPDGRFSGTVRKGLILTTEMKDLYRKLSQAGITPYVCSASPEWLVELLCCDKAFGLGLPAERVYGLRFIDREDGTWGYDETYPQPYKEGKVACINKFIAPLHGQRGPVLVAGDSNGDVAMLTAYPEMKVGLIIDWNRTGEIAALAARHDGRYFSQKFELN